MQARRAESMSQDHDPNSIHATARELANKPQSSSNKTPCGQYWDGVAGLYNVKPVTDGDASEPHSADDPNFKSGLLGIVCEPIS